MTISNPEAIKFANEQVRPLCEQVRALVAKIGAMQTAWFAGINTEFPNDTTALADNRDAEGASRLTGVDVNSAVGVLIAVAAASNVQIIQKPCVRGLTAN